jgi:excisionase family DNA binding protein
MAATPTEANPREYLNVKQAAAYLGCTVSAIRLQLVYSKAVPYVILGKRIVFSRADLDSYMAELRRAA